MSPRPRAPRDASPQPDADPEAERLESDLCAWITAAPAGFTGPGATRAARYSLDPARGAELERRFESLALASFAFQYARIPIYRAYCDRLGRDPGRVTHADEVPPLPVDAFKRARIAAFAPERERAAFHTSGTTGAAPGILHLDGLELYELALQRGFEHHVVPDTDRIRMLVLAPHPHEAPHSSLAHMLWSVRRRWGAPGSQVLFRGGGVRWLELRAALESARDRGQPLCLLGTAFVWVHVLEACAREGFRLALPPGSRAFETGGYKGRSRELSRAELRLDLERWLGVPATHVVSEYGMTELGSQYYTLGLRQALLGEPPQDETWSFPAWLRPRLVDSESGAAQAPESAPAVGLLAHHDLANRASVAHLLTADLGRAAGVSFELLGRCPRAEPRGCGLVHEGWEVAT